MDASILMSSDTDMEFMIKGLVSYKLFGQTFWITTSHVCILVVMLLLIGLAIAVNRSVRRAKPTDVPGTLQNIAELGLEALDNMVKTAMGSLATKGFLNYIGTLFLFIWVSNLSGVLGLRPPTADYGTTLGLALITFTLIHIVQIRTNKPKVLWEELCHPLPPWLPIWLPINLLSEISVPVSLSLRLFANILTGIVIMSLIYSMMGQLALIWPAALHAYLDLFVGSIQAYVFTMLTMTYISNSAGDVRHEKSK